MARKPKTHITTQKKTRRTPRRISHHCLQHSLFEHLFNLYLYVNSGVPYGGCYIMDITVTLITVTGIDCCVTVMISKT